MDRSFLSQPEVIKASRDFVCVRLATYENKKEAEFTKKFYSGFNGEIQNTTFMILTPDAKRTLLRGSRGPRLQFRDAKDLAKAMTGLAIFYSDEKALGEKASLPTAANVRLALNIASGDNLPLALVYAKSEAELKKLTQRMQKLAWSESFIGRFIYATTTNAKELKPIQGTIAKSGIYIVQPDRFGQKGVVLAKVAGSEKEAKWVSALNVGVKMHKVFSKSMREHLRAGQREGIFWKTQIPVTDPMEAQARERTKRSLNRNR